VLLDIDIEETLLANCFFDVREKLVFLAGVMFVNCRVPTQAIANEILKIRRLNVWSLDIYAVEATEERVVNYTHCTRGLYIRIGISSLHSSQLLRYSATAAEVNFTFPCLCFGVSISEYGPSAHCRSTTGAGSFMVRSMFYLFKTIAK
jgi:hypothetical protein